MPLPQRLAAARAAGFRAVEFWWPFDAAVPDDGAVDAFVTAVQDAGVRLTHLNFAGGDLSAGERGLLSHPHASQEFRDSVEVAVDIGARLGTVGFNALYGNRVDGLDRGDQDALASENLAYAARAAARIDADILVEPLSAVPSYPLHHAAEAIAVCERVRREHGVGNVALLADLYHLATNGDDLDEVLTRYAGHIGHIQLADVPGRSEPGTGTIDFTRHLATLAGIAYRGRISLEYRATRADTFDWIPGFPDVLT